MSRQRTVQHLSNIEVDEISLVDRPAVAGARIAIAKRAPQEETVDDEYFNEQGDAVNPEQLELGDTVYDVEGNAFELTEADDDDNEMQELVDEREFESVGKSLGQQVREDLSKAFSEVERDDVISKAMDEISKADQRAYAAEMIAKSERDLRLTREYISKAADYGVAGVTPEELGPVMMRAAEALPYEDCVVLHKAFNSAGEAFAELGYTGGAEGGNDPFAIVDQLIGADVSKAADGVTRDAAIAKAFADNPHAYDEYRASMAR